MTPEGLLSHGRAPLQAAGEAVLLAATAGAPPDVGTSSTLGGLVAMPAWQEANEQQQLMLFLLGAYLLFFGQCGFAFSEAGAVRNAASKRVPFRVLLQTAITLLTWWAVGHALAFGDQLDNPAPRGFIGGHQGFFLAPGSDSSYATGRPGFAAWSLQAALAATAVAIAASGLAERGRLAAHVAVAIVHAGWVYPVVAHWVWSESGWLSARRDAGGPTLGGNGVIDAGGAGVVHLLSGAAALIGAASAGPRKGRFHSGAAGSMQPMPGSSVVLVAAGSLMRWFAFYGQIPSSAAMMVQRHALYAASRAAVSATLAASAAATVGAAVDMVVRRGRVDHRPAVEGALAGLVAISGAAAIVEPFAAVLIGALAAPAYLVAAWLLARVARTDDPANAVAVALLPGLWGLVAPGFFAKPALLEMAGYPEAGRNGCGVFYGGNGMQLGRQVLGAAVLIVWGLAWPTLLFTLLRFARLLRLNAADEVIGWYGYVDPSAVGNKPVPLVTAGELEPNLMGLNRFVQEESFIEDTGGLASDRSGTGPVRGVSGTARGHQMMRGKDYYTVQRAVTATRASEQATTAPATAAAGQQHQQHLRAVVPASPRSPRVASIITGAAGSGGTSGGSGAGPVGASCVVTAGPAAGLPLKQGARAAVAGGAAGRSVGWAAAGGGAALPSPSGLRAASGTSQLGLRAVSASGEQMGAPQRPYSPGGPAWGAGPPQQQQVGPAAGGMLPLPALTPAVLPVAPESQREAVPQQGAE